MRRCTTCELIDFGSHEACPRCHATAWEPMPTLTDMFRYAAACGMCDDLFDERRCLGMLTNLMQLPREYAGALRIAFDSGAVRQIKDHPDADGLAEASRTLSVSPESERSGPAVRDTIAQVIDAYRAVLVDSGAIKDDGGASGGANDAATRAETSTKPDPSGSASTDETEKTRRYRAKAEQGDAHSQDMLGWAYEHGLGVDEDLTQASYWYRKSAEQGNRDAQWRIAYQYRHGRGVDKDPSQAAAWYEKAALAGLRAACTDLADMYRKGEGIPQDYAKAVKWYTEAAGKEDVNAWTLFWLGYMYEHGQGVEQDHAQAAQWYEKAAKMGYPYAQTALAGLCRCGTGVEQSDAQAFAWYRKAAEQGDKSGQSWLGYMYEHGQGVVADLVQAKIWYAKAAAQGDDYAKRRLDHLRAES